MFTGVECRWNTVIVREINMYSIDMLKELDPEIGLDCEMFVSTFRASGITSILQRTEHSEPASSVV